MAKAEIEANGFEYFYTNLANENMTLQIFDTNSIIASHNHNTL